MKKWTQQEDRKLKELATSQTTAEIARTLGRTYHQVYSRLQNLGIRPFKKEKSVEDYLKEDILKKEKSISEKKVKHLLQENELLRKERDALLQVGEVKTYKIRSDNIPNECPATTISLASDWHYEEPIKSSQVNGLNQFNTTIAKERIEKFFVLTAKLIKVHQREYTINNHILALLGDFISGSIHDELMEANNIQPAEAIWEVQNLISSGIKYLLANTDVKLTIPCKYGNHSRIQPKQRVATEYGNSLEMLMYKNLQQFFKGEGRVEIIVDDGYFTYLDIEGFVCRFHHGHSIRYSGGVGGMFIPTYKAINQWNKAKRADLDFFGHFHQLKDGGNFICNGSLNGYSPFAIKIKADYEDPKQAFVLITRDRGVDVVRKVNLK